ncbi:hypothetical protein [Ruegeria arenilitoris]|uniref:hypothetical protein n=1 Tax=Ruegeria arenilitoris TaxID=1173585 RepID=UPI00147B518C|nr:hypothetical protein [Ruegeria arenilitoris]
MKRSFTFLFIFLCLTTNKALANCVDLTKGNSFSLTRNIPLFEITNIVAEDGTVVEQRRMQRDGSIERVETTYWNGVIAVDRRSNSSRVQIKISEEAKLADLNKTRKTYKFPISIFVNGREIDQGWYVVKPMKKVRVSIDGCKYRAMVVRTSIERNSGNPINEEALLSLDAGMLLGNVAMTPDWKPRSSVLFDKITAN